MEDRWKDLWGMLQKGEPGAKLETTDDSNLVIISYPDGSQGVWRWRHEHHRWIACESHYTDAATQAGMYG